MNRSIIAARSVHAVVAGLTALFVLQPSFAGSETPSQEPRETFSVTDESPNGIALSPDGSTLYVGGAFRAAGLPTGALGAVDPATGAVDHSFLESRVIGGEVWSVVPDGAGGWFVGGDFALEGTTSSRAIARLGPDGSLSPWNPQVSGRIWTMRREGSVLYVGGRIDSVGPSARRNLAAFDVATGALLPWAPLVAGNNGTFDTAHVFSIDVVGSTVCFGGSFGKVNDETRRNAAAVDGATGALRPWNPDVEGNVSSVAHGQGRVFVGGCFQAVGGQPRTNLSSTDPTSGAPDAWSPALDQCVSTLAVEGSTLYLGGRFEHVNGQARGGLAAFDLATDALRPWSPAIAGNDGASTELNDICVDGATVYVAGSFLSVNGSVRNNLAAVDTVTGALLPWQAHAAGPSSTYVRSVSVAGGRVVAGGKFTMLGAEPRLGAAAINTRTGLPRAWAPTFERSTGGGPFTPGRVLTFLHDGDRVFVGGSFGRVNGVLRNALVAINPTTGELIPGFAPQVSGYVTSLAIKGSTLYIGGRFGAVGGLPRLHVAAVDANTGAVIASWDGGVALPIPLEVEDVSLSPDGQRLYVAGDFDLAGNMSTNPADWPLRQSCAAFNADTGALLSWSTAPNAGGSAVVDDGAVVWLGGTFRHFEPLPGGVYPRPQIASLRRTNGIPTFWSTWANGPGAPTGTSVIRRRGDIVFFGGSFTELLAGWFGGSAPANYDWRPYLAAMRASAAEVLAWTPAPNSSVGDIAISDRALFASGGFTSIGGRYRPGLAAFDFPFCAADLDGDGVVGSSDLSMLLGSWGATDSPADLSADGDVGSEDLAALLGAWGPCP